MLSLADLLEHAQEEGMPTAKRRGIVREYLQTLLLLFVQQTGYAPKLVFIGGTALRFFHALRRFSEDLDFNYLGTLERKDMETIADVLVRQLGDHGIRALYSVRKSRETYFHWKVYIQFPDVLQTYGCAGRHGSALHRMEKLSIQLDFQNLGRKKYPMEKKLIDRFGYRFVFTTTSRDMFLAEKSNAMLFRKPARGRDFFDWMSLVLLGARADRTLLSARDITVSSVAGYCDTVKQRVESLDFAKLSKQLEPFLFRREDIAIMANFPDHINELLARLNPAS